MTIYRGVGGSGDSSTGEDVFGDNSSITSLNGISGAIQTPTYIKFAPNANHTASQGELTWNTAEGTLDLGLNHGGVVLQIGQELHYRVTNQSGSNISDGTLVAFVGTTGNSGKLLIDVYDGTQSSKAILGLTTETIINGANGYVTSFGKVRGIQTNGANYGETWVDGDILYPSPTGLTNVLPQAPAAKQPVAVVVNAHNSNGELFVRVQSGTTLAEDELVQLTGLAHGDILQYNSVSGRFENTNPSGISLADGDYGDITVSAGASVFTVDNDAITYAKIQNVSATDKLLGRSSVGAGDIEEITCTQAGRNLLDDATVAAQRTTLGVTATGADTTYAYRANNLSDLANAATARTNLGLGTLATQAANNVAITGGSITGITDLDIADGGTGASTAANAFTNLKQDATSTTTGVVELATDAETQAGTDTTRAVTPANLKASILGLGQTWTDVTASRSLGTTYTNSTGKPIQVAVSATGSGVSSTFKATVNGVDLLTIFSGATQNQGSLWFIVPNGSTYSVSQVVATITKQRWVELR